MTCCMHCCVILHNDCCMIPACILRDVRMHSALQWLRTSHASNAHSNASSNDVLIMPCMCIMES
eukprot:scaffold102882_cov17-Tisochrysis_lutea.AAC.1